MDGTSLGRRASFPIVDLSSTRECVSRRLGLRSSSFRWSGFPTLPTCHVTCALTIQPLHSIDNLSFVTFCALKAASRS